MLHLSYRSGENTTVSHKYYKCYIKDTMLSPGLVPNGEQMLSDRPGPGCSINTTQEYQKKKSVIVVF